MPEQLYYRPALDLAPLLTIHRGFGFVCFAAKRPGPDGPVWCELGGIHTSALSAVLPGWWDDEGLDLDSYASVNAFMRAGYRYRDHVVPRLAVIEGQRVTVYEERRARSSAIPGRVGLYWPNRRADNVASFCAAFADIDCDRVGLTPGAAIGRVIEMQDARAVPPVSVFVRSGNGIWCLWLLRDAERPELAQRAGAATVRALYRRVQAAIHARLAPLGADGNATDIARVARLPGSVNTSAADPRERVVRYLVQADRGGAPFLYTLAELAEAFGVAPALPTPTLARALAEDPERPRQSEAQRRRNARGWRAAAQRTLRDLHVLLAARGGGFDLGTRNAGVYYGAVLLRKNGAPRDEVLAWARTVARHCRPPLPEAEAERAARSALQHPRWPKHTEVCAALRITEHEATTLHVFTAGRHVPPETEPPRTRREHQQARRDELAALIRPYAAPGYRVPPLRQLQALLAARGYPCSSRSVWLDLRALGVPASRRGRPKNRTLF